MQRHHKRSRRGTTLNLVSLMDIFTILVFFLLVNSSEVNILPNTKSIKLPESIVEQKPRETLFIVVNENDLLVQGRFVAKVPDILASDNNVIDALKRELEHQASRSPLIGLEGEERRDITILGDKDIPYRLLKKIMVTCNSVNYSNISLAVTKKTSS